MTNNIDVLNTPFNSSNIVYQNDANPVERNIHVATFNMPKIFDILDKTKKREFFIQFMLLLFVLFCSCFC